MNQGNASGRLRTRLIWCLAGIIGLGCWLLYRHTAGFDFVMLDDDINIIFNPHLGVPSLDRLQWMLADNEYVRRYMPLGWLGLSAVYAGSGLNPGGYHQVLIVLHAINAVLLFALIIRLQDLVAGAAARRVWPVVCAGIAAAAWALHPMGVEAVAWASGLLYAQALLFLLLSLLAYVSAQRNDIEPRSRATRGLLALALYTGSLLSYPIAVGVMPAIIGYQYWRQRKGALGSGQTDLIAAGPYFRARAGFLVISAAVLAITVSSRYTALPQWGEASGLLSKSLPERLAQASYVLTYYFWKPWWPTNLSPVYTTLATIDPWSGRFLMSGGAILLAVLAGLRWPWWKTRVGPCLVAYGVMMFPFLGFSENFHIAYDRYAIVPGMFMAIFGALLLGQITRTWLRAAVTGALLVVVTGWAWLSYQQTWAWKDTLALHRHISSKLTDFEFPMFKYRRSAFLLFTYGQRQEAEALIAKGQALFPGNEFIEQSARDFLAFRDYYLSRSDAAGGDIMPLAIQHADAGLAAIRRREWREGEEHLRCALALAPHYYSAAYNRALCLLELDRPREALHSFYEALAYAGPQLSEASRRAFLQQLAAKAAELGDLKLAELAELAARPTGV